MERKRKRFRCLGSFFQMPKGYAGYCSNCIHKEEHKEVVKETPMHRKPTGFMCNHALYPAHKLYRCLCFPVDEAAVIALHIKMGLAEFRKTWCDYD